MARARRIPISTRRCGSPTGSPRGSASRPSRWRRRWTCAGRTRCDSGTRPRRPIPSTRRPSSSRATSATTRIRIDEAIPYFRQAVRLDPNYRLAAEHLTDALVEAGLATENLAWLREQVPLARTSSDLQSIGRAFLAAGHEEEAVPLFRRSAEIDGGPWPRLSLAEYLCFTGRAAEVEGAARAWLEGNPPDGTPARKDSVEEANRALSIALRSQGRIREWDARAAIVAPGPRAAQFRRRQASGIGGDIPGFVSANDAIRGGGAWVVYQSAHLAGYAGMLAVAGPLGAEFLASPEASEPQPVELAVVKGLAASTVQAPDAARQEFEMVAAWPRMMARWKGSILLGHLLREQGDCTAAIPAYERARAASWSPAVDERIVMIPQLSTRSPSATRSWGTSRRRGSETRRCSDGGEGRFGAAAAPGGEGPGREAGRVHAVT